ncbi:MAG: peptidylprolyl isomerase [Paludibacteraceae bacterium]|nr:peptidylprolyl isomerase [Paludibacteraceae bacterium]
MKIENQKVATLIYEMFVVGEDGKEEVMETATMERPLIYCHGEGMMLPAFEAAMLGKDVDDPFDFVITPEQAYGDYDESGVMTLDKKLFYNGDDEFDAERVYEGAIVPMNTVDGQVINAQVVEITDDKVTIDLNHPLSGETLHFVGKVVDVRDVTPGELKALHQRGQCGRCKGDCNSCESDCGSRSADCANGCC